MMRIMMMMMMMMLMMNIMMIMIMILNIIKKFCHLFNHHHHVMTKNQTIFFSDSMWASLQTSSLRAPRGLFPWWWIWDDDNDDADNDDDDDDSRMMMTWLWLWLQEVHFDGNCNIRDLRMWMEIFWMTKLGRAYIFH